MSNIINEIKDLAISHFEEIQKIRRHLHTYPELSFQEYETSKYIKEKLSSWNIHPKKEYVETGFVVGIKGELNGTKKVGLRADMDALPIKELNEVSYKSLHDGVMHACGHDVHTSCLLGALKILNETKSQWGGEVIGVFQPGEEKLPGGANLMIGEGLLEENEFQLMIGQHVYPELEVGNVGLKSGMYMASADEIYLNIIGKGGHAALPHKTIDPVLISGYVITALQQIVSRFFPPNIPAVLSFGKIEGLGATNVIPDEVKLEGTFRTMNEEWRLKAHERIKEIAISTCEAHGANCEIEIKVGYPCLINDPKLTTTVRSHMIDYMGRENVTDLDLRMTGEDFAYFSQNMPACFYRLGTGNSKKGITAAVHNPKFDIDEESLKTGMGLMAYLAIKHLEE